MRLNDRRLNILVDRKLAEEITHLIPLGYRRALVGTVLQLIVTRLRRGDATVRDILEGRYELRRVEPPGTPGDTLRAAQRN